MQDTPVFEQVCAAQAEEVSALAYEIWREYYISIITSQQIEYMIHKFQSPEAIREQIDAGYTYYLLRVHGEPAGYFAYVPDDKGLFLSKLYIRRAFRRQGLGHAVMEHVIQAAAALFLPCVYLTVNRGNAASVAAYEAYGFHTEGVQDADIGQGYVMDDYVMVLPIAAV